MLNHPFFALCAAMGAAEVSFLVRGDHDANWDAQVVEGRMIATYCTLMGLSAHDTLTILRNEEEACRAL